jgi:hypothetical protein
MRYTPPFQSSVLRWASELGYGKKRKPGSYFCGSLNCCALLIANALDRQFDRLGLRMSVTIESKHRSLILINRRRAPPAISAFIAWESIKLSYRSHLIILERESGNLEQVAQERHTGIVGFCLSQTSQARFGHRLTERNDRA